MAEWVQELIRLHTGRGKVVNRCRNAAAGNFRGAHLEFTESFRKSITDDPLFRKAHKRALESGCICRFDKLMNFYLIFKYGLPRDGRYSIVEFGSYKGGSAIFMATLLEEINAQINIYALDTFEGMPKVNPDVNFHQTGDFADTSYEFLIERIKAYNLKNIEPVKGLFIKTFPEIFIKAAYSPIILSHIDCDIYESVFYATFASISRMASGGYIIYDDPLCGKCVGAMTAVEDTIYKLGLHAEQTYPHLVYRYPPIKC